MKQVALDESIADIFAIAFKHWLGQGNWIIRGFNRDLSQFAHLNNFIGAEACTEETDYGYVHANSLIPSHAFYLAVKSLGNDYLARMTHIWFNAFQRIINPQEAFSDFAAKTLQVASDEV